MRAVRDEFLEPLACLRDGVRARDAGAIEAVRARSFQERVLDGAGIGQKSRSA